ncbi:retrovirus-related pol polyprotein from transposon TNT 1-94 [Tanacetum coccineum]|uniref:Retrovirus-related pol polyprotein from transposon TNT 1-94 n=1 Tax=Tanacetum coccineum TaxID=301880 RepID=A0ABQ4YRB9_9ASTR
MFIYNHKDHLGKLDAKADDGYFLGCSFNSKSFRVFNTRRQQIEETYHVTFDKSMESITFTNTSYIIPHGRSLTELTQGKHVPEVIASNEPDIPYTEDAEGPSGQNIEVSVSIIESSVLNVPQSHISNQASTSMLTRSMAAKLIAASASECLFAYFLSEIEPKKVSEVLKHPGWVDAMQEELNQFYRNKVWIVVPLPHGKIAIGSKCQEEGIDYDETFALVARMEAIKIFLAFAIYMNFIVFQMDVKSAFLNGKLKEEVYVKQPLGFKSSEFPDYVYKLDKALYGLKQAPMACLMCKISVKSKGITSDCSEKNPQVLGGKYSSTEQVNSTQQPFAYCFLIGTKVDIGEIIYSDLVTMLTNKSRQRYVSYSRFVSCALAELLGPDYTQDECFGSSPTILSNYNFSKDPSKVTLIKLMDFMVAVNKREHLVNSLPCFVKKKKGKSQTMTPTLPQS